MTRAVDEPSDAVLPDALALVAEDQVPHRLMPVLRRRERRAAETAFHALAALDELAAAGGVLLRVLDDPLGEARAAPGGVDVDPIAAREALEHFLGGVAQLVGVLLEVLRGDGEQRLVVGGRVDLAAGVL